MWLQIILFLVSSSILSASAIIVPIDNKEDVTESTTVTTANDTQETTHYNSEDAHVDSYLIPPNLHKPQEVLPDIVVTPATYLLPPSSEQDTQFFYPPTEAGEQTDWYPIAQVLPPSPTKRQAVPIFVIDDGPLKIENIRVGKSYTGDRHPRSKPSVRLEPPPLNAPNEYIVPSSSEQLGIPFEQIKQLNPNSYKIPYTDVDENVPYSDILLQKTRLKQEEPGLALHLTPPKPALNQQKYPTNLYPKKYSGGFKPVPIPIAQFAEDTLSIPRAKPVNYLKPVPNSDLDFIPEPEDKKSYLYKQAEQKRKFKSEGISQPQQLDSGPIEDTQAVTIPTEQETSETINRYPGPNIYSARIREAPRPAPQHAVKSPAAPDERTEFRMHGMKGPHSYQFGYDTGKGKNRQFRYEERDNDGQIRGHYGYMDKHGKLRVVNYSAHPELGFHAEAPVEKE